MNRLVAAAFAVLLGGAAAHAADYPGYGRGMPDHGGAGSIWQGAYFGANFGWADGKLHGEIPGVLRGSIAARGALGGVHAGYNVFAGSAVYGVEIDAQFAGIEGQWEPLPGASLQGELKWFSTLRGRVGLPSGNFLLYGTGGLAIGGGKATASIGGASASATKTHVGWTLGVGAEMALNQELSVRLEYLYADFGEKNYLSGTGLDSSAGLRAHIFRIGATAHF